VNVLDFVGIAQRIGVAAYVILVFL